MRDFDRFYMNYFQNAGYIVLVLDISSVLKQPTINPDIRVKDEVIVCSSTPDIFIKLNKFKPDYVLNFINRFMLRCYFKRWFIINFSNLLYKTVEYCGPNGPFDSSSSSKFKDIVKKLLFRNCYKNFSYSIVSGAESLKNSLGDPIYLHTADYDLYLKSKEKSNANAKSPKNLLFLDEDFVFHEDYEIIDMDAPVTAENYYSEVNYMLRNLGERFEMEPVIQVHPSADRELARKHFEFPLSEVETMQAVMNAELIVSHDSTALQMAVFCHKPVVLLETSEIVRSEYYHTQIHRFADALGCSVLTPEDFEKDLEFPKVCDRSYARYMKDFVKMYNSDERYSYEMLASFFVNQYNSDIIK